MKEVVTKIIEKVNTSNDIKRNIIQDELMELNNILKSLEEYPERTFNLFKLTEEERLREIEQKIILFKDRPIVGLQEGVRFSQDKLRKFLKVYFLGFISSFSLNKNGWFDVVINNSIHCSSSFGNREYSSKIEFEYQMDILRSYGFDVKVEKKSAILLATNNNIQLLNMLLGNIGCKLIKITTDTDFDTKELVIDKITFKISPIDLLNTDFKPIEINFSESEELNPDEKAFILKEIKSLYESYSTMYSEWATEEINASCSQIIRSAFSSICKTCNIETSISKKYWDKCNKHREINLLIAEKETELGSLISGSVLKTSATNVYNYIEKLVWEKLHLCCTNLEIQPYKIEATLKFTSFLFEIDDSEPISEEELSNLFETRGNINDETFEILGTERNIDKLKDIISKLFPNTEISKVELNYKNGFVLNEFRIVIQNLNDFYI